MHSNNSSLTAAAALLQVCLIHLQPEWAFFTHAGEAAILAAKLAAVGVGSIMLLNVNCT
jgi:hypothetical protein